MAVQVAVQRAGHDRHLGMGLGQAGHALRRGDQAEEADLRRRHAARDQHVDGMGRRAAGGQHGVDQQCPARLFRQLHVVLLRLLALGIAENADVSLARHRHQFANPFGKAEPGAQDRDDGDLSRQVRRLHFRDRRFDRAALQRQVAGDLVTEQQAQLAQQLAEGDGRRGLVAQHRQLVLHQRMRHEAQVGEALGGAVAHDRPSGPAGVVFSFVWRTSSSVATVPSRDVRAMAK